MVPLPSGSTMSAAAISTGSHVLKVEGYSQTKRLVRTGECIKSAKFKAAGHTWRIRYYPKGCSTKSEGCFSLGLELASSASTDVHANFRFSLVRSGKLPADTPSGGGGMATFAFGNRVWLSSDLATKEEQKKLEAEYLENDSFLVRCDITVMNKHVVRRHGLEQLGLVCNRNYDKSSKASGKQQSRLVVLVKKASDKIFGCLSV